MGLKQQLLNMGLNVFGLDLFVKSYNETVCKLLDDNPNFPKDKLNLKLCYPMQRPDSRGGDCQVTITIEPSEDSKVLGKATAINGESTND